MDFKGENIDRIFREGLKDFEVAPPSEVWEGVMQARTYKKKGVLPIFRYAAAVVAMLLVVGSLYTIINKPRPDESVAKSLNTGSPSSLYVTFELRIIDLSSTKKQRLFDSIG